MVQVHHIRLEPRDEADFFSLDSSLASLAADKGPIGTNYKWLHLLYAGSRSLVLGACPQCWSHPHHRADKMI